MSKKSKQAEIPAAEIAPEVTPEVTEAAPVVAEVTETTPTESPTTEAKRGRGRPAGSKNAPKVAPITAKLSFADGKLTADNGAEFVGGMWQVGVYNAESAKAELQAARENAEKLAAIVANLAALPVDVDPLALLAAKVDSESVYAAMAYKMATR